MVTLIHNNYTVFGKNYSVTKLPCNISVFPIENFWQYLICLCLVSIVLEMQAQEFLSCESQKCGRKSFYHVNLRNAGAIVFNLVNLRNAGARVFTMWISEMRVQEFLPCKSQKFECKSFYQVNLRNAGARVFTMWISRS